MLHFTQSKSHGPRLPRRLVSASEHEAWQRLLLDIYSRMRQRAQAGPYDTFCAGIQIAVLPEVYAPGFFSDSCWFASVLPEVVGSGSLLEVGTGTGIIAIACAKRGASVVATDINPCAIENARMNAKRHRLKIDVRMGDLYSASRQEERFDFIFWAHPFNNWNEPVSDVLMKSGRDYRYQSLKGYIHRARNHLNETGRLLLGTGDSADIDAIECMARDAGYELRVLRQVDMPIEEGGTEPVTYLLVEFARV